MKSATCRGGKLVTASIILFTRSSGAYSLVIWALDFLVPKSPKSIQSLKAGLRA